MRRTPPIAALALLALPAAPAADAKDIWGGVRFGYYTDVEEPFLGAELLVRVTDQLFFNPNFEWVFVENYDYYTINADLHYDFPTRGAVMFWLGAGLGLVRTDFEGEDNGDTDAAANFLAGVGLGGRSVIPYFQLKVIAKDDSEVALGFGLRF
jgi:hypothetical protein